MFQALVLLVLAQAQTPTDLSDLLRVVTALHEPVKDISFICEGEIRFVGPARLLDGKPPIQDRYQGYYVYRSDGAGYFDLYSNLGGDGPLSRTKHAVLRDAYERYQHIPDKNPQPLVRTMQGASGSLDFPKSPHRFLFYWYFTTFRPDTATFMEPPRWETVDGHSCLLVHIDDTPQFSAARKRRVKFWIDLARGGHPVREEYYAGRDLLIRKLGIRLAQTTPEDGAVAWVPTSATVETFGWGKENYDSPMIRETYNVVKGSIRLNRKLTDKMFTVSTPDRPPADPGFAATGQTFQEAAAKAPDRRPRTDPEGIEQNIRAQLAVAERQAEMIEASSPARRVWDWWTILPVASSVLGTIILLGVLLWRRHSP